MKGQSTHSILTKNEVNALLLTKNTIPPFVPLSESKEKIPETNPVCESFLRLFQISLAQYLKKQVHLCHVSTDKMKFSELKIILSSKKSVRLLQLDNSNTKIYGLFVFDNHFYSDPKLLNTLVHDLTKALESLGQYSIHVVESIPHVSLETIPSHENMILMTYEIEHTPQTTMSVIVPLSVFQSKTLSDSKITLDLLLDVPLKVTVELGHTKMKIQDVLKLSCDSVVELPTLIKQPLSVLINDELIAKGHVVVVNEKFAVRITEILPLTQRIEKFK